DALLGGGVDLVELAVAVEDLLGGGQVEADQAGPAEVVGLAEADDAADREGPGRPLEQHLDLVAGLVAGVLGRLGVDGQLTGAAGETPGTDGRAGRERAVLAER